MIYKELDPFQSDDKFAKSGRAAEEQMAFYLKRFFANDPNILILNSIRLEEDGDAAQIDHLAIHPYGFVIIESKSVHGKVQIKDDGQWIRWFGQNQSKGMPSPITQALLQEKFFRSYLGRSAKNERLFNAIPFDNFVAISNEGVIIWPKSGQVPGVCKTDQVPEKIIEAIAKQAKSPKALVLTPENRKKIADFLLIKHRPLQHAATAVPSQPAPQTVAPPPHQITPAQVKAAPNPLTPPVCKHCGSDAVEIRYGHSYYIFCTKCNKNTPIRLICPSCNTSPRLRKHKQEFFVECESCKTSQLYYVNP